jgi:hypothetical protein
VLKRILRPKRGEYQDTGGNSKVRSFRTVFFSNVIWVIKKKKKDEMGGKCSIYRTEGKGIQNFGHNIL